MASNRDDLLARYNRTRPPAPIYSRWCIAPNGVVTRELMPSFIVRDRSVPDGYALKDSAEDRENERAARQAAGQPVPEAAPKRAGPPPVQRLRPGR